MYLWIIKRPNILAFVGNIECRVISEEVPVTLHVATCHVYVD